MDDNSDSSAITMPVHSFFVAQKPLSGGYSNRFSLKEVLVMLKLDVKETMLAQSYAAYMMAASCFRSSVCATLHFIRV